MPTFTGGTLPKANNGTLGIPFLTSSMFISNLMGTDNNEKQPRNRIICGYNQPHQNKSAFNIDQETIE